MEEDDLAGDAVQDACLLAFRKLSSYQEVHSTTGWRGSWLTFAMMSYVVSGVIQSSPWNPYRRLTMRCPPSWLAYYSTNPEIQCEINEFEHIIQACLENIPPHYHAVLVLIDMEELSYEDASDILQIPIGTIKSRLARARLQMRNAMQAFDDLLSTRYQIQSPLSLKLQ